MTTRAALATESVNESGSFVSNMINGPLALMTDDLVEPGLLVGTAVTAFGAGVVTGSIYARKRAAAGKEPILGFVL